MEKNSKSRRDLDLDEVDQTTIIMLVENNIVPKI